MNLSNTPTKQQSVIRMTSDVTSADEVEQSPRQSSRWGAACSRCVERIRQGGKGWGVSFLLHGALLLCLYAVIIGQAEQRSPLSINSAISEEAGDEAFDTLLDDAAFTPVPMEGQDQPLMVSQQEALAEESDFLIPTDQAKADNLRGKSADAGTSGGKTGFFGTVAAGDSFVFIVDSSGSMTGQPFLRAKNELTLSIRRLKRKQKFHVIFFNSETIPMFQPRERVGLITATTDNRKKVRRWVKRQLPASTTDPEGAIRLALGMKPAVIFLLSDGEFDDPERCRQAALKENLAGSVIHTIAFMSEDGKKTLKAIAAEHGGTYRYVK